MAIFLDNIYDMDNVVELIPKIRLDLTKEIFESLGYNLDITDNKINYKNYMINNLNDICLLGQDIIGINDNIGDSLISFGGGKLTINDLMKIYPNANRNYANAILYTLDKYGNSIGLNDKGKLMVLAQLAHESGNFRYTAEIGKGRGKKYGNPTGPYNKIYYGRGPIQITWEQNYKKISQEIFPKMGINVDIWANPDLCEQNLVVGCAASLAWFLLPGNGKRAIACANNGDVVGLTKAINGSTNGLEERKRNTQKIFLSVKK